ncbi:hypothetical protein B0J17DRAFT_709988 [Rhizoctonia solani]|nr:hypothetical protein B0J17DRAFT_709988 [Rhizoctonia solani]
MYYRCGQYINKESRIDKYAKCGGKLGTFNPDDLRDIPCPPSIGTVGPRTSSTGQECGVVAFSTHKPILFIPESIVDSHFANQCCTMFGRSPKFAVYGEPYAAERISKLDKLGIITFLYGSPGRMSRETATVSHYVTTLRHALRMPALRNITRSLQRPPPVPYATPPGDIALKFDSSATPQHSNPSLNFEGKVPYYAVILTSASIPAYPYRAL